MQASMRARPLPSSRPRHAPFGDTAQALHAMHLLLDATTDEDAVIPLPDRLLAEARRFFRMTGAALLRVGGRPKRVQLWAVDPKPPRMPARLLPLERVDALAQLEESGAARALHGAEVA